MTPSTTTYNQGDVVLVPFPFTEDFEKNKTRPALVVSGRWLNQRGHYVILVAITGSVPVVLEPDEYHLDLYDQNQGGLLKDSIVIASKIFAVDKMQIIRKMGSIRHQTVNGVIDCISKSLKTQV